MRTTLHVHLLAGCLASSLLPTSPVDAEMHVTLIAHPTRAAALTRADVRAIYLKRKLLWSDGQPIIPINREAGSEARELFSEKVFGQDSRRLAAYWNQRYFEAGEFPPATLASEEAVVRFVAENPNAVGYVTSGSVNDSVAILLVLDW
jgi:ABC-type phosphate transport system substrate-binding protein